MTASCETAPLARSWRVLLCVEAAHRSALRRLGRAVNRAARGDDTRPLALVANEPFAGAQEHGVLLAAQLGHPAGDRAVLAGWLPAHSFPPMACRIGGAACCAGADARTALNRPLSRDSSPPQYAADQPEYAWQLGTAGNVPLRPGTEDRSK